MRKWEWVFCICLSFSGIRITVGYTEGRGRHGSKENRKRRMINIWRQARRLTWGRLKQIWRGWNKQGEVQSKLLSYRYSLISSWLCFFFCRSLVGFAPCLVDGASCSHVSPGADPVLPLLQCSSTSLTACCSDTTGYAFWLQNCNWELGCHLKKR